MHRLHVCARHEAVSGMPAPRAGPRAIDHLPVAAELRANVASGVRLALDEGLAYAVRVAVRIAGAGGDEVRLHLQHRVGVAVDAHVQAHVEVVLVHHRVQVGSDEAPVLRRFVVGRGAAVEHAGQLRLEPDGPVEVEVPEDAVVVVAHRVEGGDDETARTAHFRAAPLEIAVLPEHSVVFLVHADGVRVVHRFSVAVRHVHVEVVDLAHAVAAELESEFTQTPSPDSPRSKEWLR